MEKYKEASRIGLRVATPKGTLSVEQLWHLPLEDLDVTLVGLDKASEKKKTFLKNKTEENFLSELAFEIAHDILVTRMDEREAAKNARAKKLHNQKIMGIITEKKDQVLMGSTIEELEKLLKD